MKYLNAGSFSGSGAGVKEYEDNYPATFGKEEKVLQNCAKCGYLFKTALVLEPHICPDCTKKLISDPDWVR